jgi:hypothetical protein
MTPRSPPHTYGIMTMTLEPEWDEAAHSRAENTGRFTSHIPSAPEIDAFTPNRDDAGYPDRTEYNPSFTFPANFLDVAQSKIDTANRKLAKLGVAEQFTFETASVMKTINGKTFEYVTVTLNRPTIGFDGWTFTGAHDFTPGGGVLHFVSTPDLAEVTDNHCDHCGANRARNRVYTVVHPEKGTMQVGASCLEAFMGLRPAGLWALEANLDLDHIEDFNRSTANLNSRVYDPQELLIAALTASKDGCEYVSSSNADFVHPPTAIVVSRDWEKLLAAGDTKERGILARKIMRWARKIDAEPGTYMGNLHELFAGKKEDVWVRAKHLGFAVSAVSAYRREQDKLAVVKVQEKQKTLEQRAYLGGPKDKVKNLVATIQHVSKKTEYYGRLPKDSTWMRMITDDGFVLTWNASGDKEVKAGDRVAIATATVETHEEYRGSFQTKISRAKMMPLEATPEEED